MTIKLKELVPNAIRTRIHEEELDAETKKVFDDLMRDLSFGAKSAVAGIENKVKSTSEDELEKIAQKTDSELGKLAQESVQKRKRLVREKRGVIKEEAATIILVASVALALPKILELIGALAGKIKKDSNFAEKIASAGHLLHKMYIKVLRKVLDYSLFALPGMELLLEPHKQRITEILFVVLVAYLGVKSGTAAYSALSKLKLGGAAVEGALAAVKGGEVTQYVVNSIKTVLSAATSAT